MRRIVRAALERWDERIVARPRWRFQWARTVDHERDRLPMTRAVLEHLDAGPGHHVADVGAGAGYFTFQLAEHVGASGRVRAIDRSLEACVHLTAEQQRRGCEQVSVRWMPMGLHLGAARWDRVLCVNVFLFEAGRAAAARRLLVRIARSLRPGGVFLFAVDTVHTPAWSPPYGKGRTRADASSRELIAAAREHFDVEVARELICGPPEPGKEPGFLLRLRKR